MADVKIKLNSPGIRALLSSQEMKNAIAKEAVARGEIVKTFIGGDRIHVIIKEGGETDAGRSKDN